MPIYEFVCQACGYDFEKIQSFSDATVPTCPRCQSAQVQRQMGRPAIHFKGSGWYITDSKSDNKERKESVKKAGEGETGGEKTSDTGNKDNKENAPQGDAAPAKEATKESSTPEKSAAPEKSTPTEKSAAT